MPNWCEGTFRARGNIENLKMYGIAIKVNGFERGAQFEHSVETTASGTVKEDIVRKYDDWDWDCPMPLLGG